eukprot:358893-Chlamydomonas_euryale.AAC.7
MHAASPQPVVGRWIRCTERPRSTTCEGGRAGGWVDGWERRAQKIFAHIGTRQLCTEYVVKRGSIERGGKQKRALSARGGGRGGDGCVPVCLHDSKRWSSSLCLPHGGRIRVRIPSVEQVGTTDLPAFSVWLGAQMSAGQVVNAMVRKAGQIQPDGEDQTMAGGLNWARR